MGVIVTKQFMCDFCGREILSNEFINAMTYGKICHIECMLGENVMTPFTVLKFLGIDEIDVDTKDNSVPSRKLISLNPQTLRMAARL